MKRRLTDKPEPPVDLSVQLSMIAGCEVDFDCTYCGHHGTVTATELMKAKGGAASFKAVVSRMRCSQCGRIGAPEIRIRSGPKASPFDDGAAKD